MQVILRLIRNVWKNMKNFTKNVMKFNILWHMTLKDVLNLQKSIWKWPKLKDVVHLEYLDKNIVLGKIQINQVQWFHQSLLQKIGIHRLWFKINNDNHNYFNQMILQHTINHNLKIIRKVIPQETTKMNNYKIMNHHIN